MPEVVVEVAEFTDPACSWAWGTEPKLRLLRWRYGDRLRWRRVLGGLIPDRRKTVPNWDPRRAARRQPGYWRNVWKHTGMSYPVSLDWMFTSTEPAGKAVKAADEQGAQVGERVLRRLREETFIFRRPPDTTARILEALREVPGLDVERFGEDLESERVAKLFREDWEETRRPDPWVLDLDETYEGAGRAKHTDGYWRYVFPTLVFRGPEGKRIVPGWKPYERYVEAVEAVAPGSTDGGRDRPAAQAYFRRWPTATEKELQIVCGSTAPVPDGIVRHDWGEGLFFLTPDEAKARGIA
jgi:predicted DsbA family dithiol-disulfide isomerase